MQFSYSWFLFSEINLTQSINDSLKIPSYSAKLIKSLKYLPSRLSRNTGDSCRDNRVHHHTAVIVRERRLDNRCVSYKSFDVQNERYPALNHQWLISSFCTLLYPGVWLWLFRPPANMRFLLFCQHSPCLSCPRRIGFHESRTCHVTAVSS